MRCHHRYSALDRGQPSGGLQLYHSRRGAPGPPRWFINDKFSPDSEECIGPFVLNSHGGCTHARTQNARTHARTPSRAHAPHTCGWFCWCLTHCFPVLVACIEAPDGQIPRGMNVWQSFADDRSTLQITINELTQDRIPRAQEARERYCTAHSMCRTEQLMSINHQHADQGCSPWL